MISPHLHQDLVDDDDDDDDVENRLPANDNTAAVESGQVNLTRTTTVAGDVGKMNAAAAATKKFAHLMGLMMVCVLAIVIGLVIGLRGAHHTNSHHAETESPVSVSAAHQQEMSGVDDGMQEQTSLTTEIEPTTSLTRSTSDDGTSDTNIPLSSGSTSETNIPLSSGASETSIPVFQLSRSPSARPSISSAPSYSPSELSTASPTSSPSTEAPTTAPFLPLTYGQEFSWTYSDLGIEVSSGISVKLIAQTGYSVSYGDGTKSSYRYHSQMDGAGIVTLPNGGYVYVSNSELKNSDGGMLL